MDVSRKYNPIIVRCQHQLEMIQTNYNINQIKINKLKSEETKEKPNQDIDINFERKQYIYGVNDNNIEQQW